MNEGGGEGTPEFLDLWLTLYSTSAEQNQGLAQSDSWGRERGRELSRDPWVLPVLMGGWRPAQGPEQTTPASQRPFCKVRDTPIS